MVQRKGHLEERSGAMTLEESSTKNLLFSVGEEGEVTSAPILSGEGRGEVTFNQNSLSETTTATYYFYSRDHLWTAVTLVDTSGNISLRTALRSFRPEGQIPQQQEALNL